MCTVYIYIVDIITTIILGIIIIIYKQIIYLDKFVKIGICFFSYIK